MTTKLTKVTGPVSDCVALVIENFKSIAHAVRA